jgi:hypothetical protein
VYVWIVACTGCYELDIAGKCCNTEILKQCISWVSAIIFLLLTKVQLLLWDLAQIYHDECTLNMATLLDL